MASANHRRLCAVVYAVVYAVAVYENSMIAGRGQEKTKIIEEYQTHSHGFKFPLKSGERAETKWKFGQALFTVVLIRSAYGPGFEAMVDPVQFTVAETRSAARTPAD